MPGPIPRRPLLGAVLFCALALLASAGPAGAADRHDRVRPDRGTHDYATTDAMVEVVDGPSDDHHVSIDTRLYVPENASPSTPQPAILMTHGFGLAKDAAEVTSAADFLARHGYIVLTWTAQGFGESSGCITLDSFDYDVKDVRQLITEVLEPRHDVLRDDEGLVLGMLGGSYGGGITLNVAAADKRIRAIVPGRTWNALQYSLDPNNLVAPGAPTRFRHLLSDEGVFKQLWTTAFFGSGMAQPVGGLPPEGSTHGACIQEKLASGDPLRVAGTWCLGFHTEVCRVFAGISLTGDTPPGGKELLARSSVASRIADLRVPTLLVQGQADTLFNLNEAVATYTELQRRDVPVAMTWNYGGHGGYNSQPGECEVYGGGHEGHDDCYLTLRTLRWFDHYLRGEPLGDFPRFTYFRDWVDYDGKGANDEQYGVADRFPAQQAVRFLLSSGGALLPPGAAPSNGLTGFRNPLGGQPASYSETPNFTGPDSTPNLAGPPFDPPASSVSFTSEPFVRDVVSVGVPTARLFMDHTNGRDLVFFAKVFDVAPNGDATLIKRHVAPVRVPADQVDRPVDINLIGFAHRFARGHAVRLTLAATDQSSYNAKVPDTITVRTGASGRSTFSLPLESAAAVPGDVRRGGTPDDVSDPRGNPSLATTGGSAWPAVTGLVALLVATAVRRRRPARHGP